MSGAPGWRSLGLWACVALAAAAALARPSATQLGGRIEGALLDARFAARGATAPPAGVVILGADDRDLAAGSGPGVGRAALARAVAAAADAGAAVVAVDLLLLGPRQADAALAAALRRAPSALAVATTQARTEAALEPAQIDALRDSGFAVASGALEIAPADALAPAPALAAAAARLGHVDVALAPDGAARRLPMVRLARLPPGGDGAMAALPALAVAAIASATGAAPTVRVVAEGATLRVGASALPLGPDAAVAPRWYGPRGAVPTFALRDAAAAPLAGAVVFVGATATGLGDVFATPFDQALPGVELHATLAANLIEGRALRRDGVTGLADLAAAAVVAAVAFAAAARPRPAVAAAALAGVAAATAVALQAAFLLDWWLDGVSAATALGVGALGGAAARRAALRRAAANLARYQSPLLAPLLAREEAPDFDRRSQEAAALFVDVVGFTALSERAGPAATAAFLRRFHGDVAAQAERCGGVVEQFAGDGAMILFGLPRPTAGDAEAALRCAAALLAASTAWIGPDGAAARVRIGAHFGRVQAGVLGGARHRHVTVTGDVVNAASRLRDLAAAEDVAVVVSKALLDAAGGVTAWRDAFDLADLGPRRLRGRDAAMRVWAGRPVAPRAIEAPGR